jgi:hypothetical protein
VVVIFVSCHEYSEAIPAERRDALVAFVAALQDGT